MSTQLPYVFDLLYDLKTLEQLNDHLSGRQRYPVHATDTELYQMARDNGVDCEKVTGCVDMPNKLGEMYGICERHLLKPEGAMCPFCKAARMQALLVRLTRTEYGLMPDVVSQIKTLLKDLGYGDH